AFAERKRRVQADHLCRSAVRRKASAQPTRHEFAGHARRRGLFRRPRPPASRHARRRSDGVPEEKGREAVNSLDGLLAMAKSLFNPEPTPTADSTPASCFKLLTECWPVI